MITQLAQNVPTQNPPETIEILDFHAVDHRSIKAECRVKCGGFVFAGVKIIIGVLASRPFVAFPSRKVGDDWQPLITVLSPENEQRIANAVLTEWRNQRAR